MGETININGREFPVVGVARRADAPTHPPVPASKPSKYGNRYCIIGSERFDSEKEGRRHLVLLEMQKRGEIAGLIRQPEFRLEVNGILVCKYRGDWRYFENAKGDHPANAVKRQEVIEDAKGFQTREFKLKWKLAKALHPEIEWRLS